MNKTHDTPKPARFSKEDLLKEVRNLVYLQARTFGRVFGSSVSLAMLGWSGDSADIGDGYLYNDYSDFEDVAKAHGCSASLHHFDLLGVFGQLYDYGVLGLHQADMEPIEEATRPAFAAAWLYDVSGSDLIWETHNGELPEPRLARTTVDLAQARAVLDNFSGAPRFIRRAALADGLWPDSDLLTFYEVALLADMDERSVRNAASKPDSGLTTVASDDGRKSFIKADVARAWLKGRRGFVPTRDVDLVELVDILARPFDSAGAVVAYLRLMCEHRNIDSARYAALCRWSDPATVWSDARLPETPEAVHDIAAALSLDPVLFDLRLKELRLVEEMEVVRRSLKSLREEKTDAR